MIHGEDTYTLDGAITCDASVVVRLCPAKDGAGEVDGGTLCITNERWNPCPRVRRVCWKILLVVDVGWRVALFGVRCLFELQVLLPVFSGDGFLFAHYFFAEPSNQPAHAWH